MRADKVLAATPIIMLTARVEDTDKIVGLELGADDYVTKPFNAREVVARVNALLRRTTARPDAVAAPHVLATGGLRLDLDQHTLTVDGRPVELTRTEFSLLTAFMENPGYTLTRDDLLERAMGYAYEGLGRALDTHIRNLRRKIEPDPEQPTYIQTVYGVGYRLAGERRSGRPLQERGHEPALGASQPDDRRSALLRLFPAVPLHHDIARLRAAGRGQSGRPPCAG